MKRKSIWITITVIALLFILIFGIDYRINKQTENQIFKTTESIPANKAGLLLGTSKLLSSGKPNQYFDYRILAAETLFKSGKIKNIVISGDNSRKDYNEPQDMKDELLKRGIPEAHIYLDYAGFRTFDSVYRMNEIFGQTSFTIISQEFHNQRAVYIANALNLDVVAFNAKDVNVYNGLKTKIREKLARVKVEIDFLINKKPKFLGDEIIIN
uniref:SanA/YdcF family protein n=1 Tax=Flavobacterium sp. TaxID=239 RepID=UPI004049CA34